MTTATDEHGLRHDIALTWEGVHTVWHRTGCGLTLPRGELFEANYQDEQCEKCVEYKGHREKAIKPGDDVAHKLAGKLPPGVRAVALAADEAASAEILFDFCYKWNNTGPTP